MRRRPVSRRSSRRGRRGPLRRVLPFGACPGDGLIRRIGSLVGGHFGAGRTEVAV
jgi:hypothetical protein